GALDMSLPSTPDIRIKEEQPLDVDSSPPDSPGPRDRDRDKERDRDKDKVGPSPGLLGAALCPTLCCPLAAGPARARGAQHPRHPRAPHPQRRLRLTLGAPGALRGQNGEWGSSLSLTSPWALPLGWTLPFGLDTGLHTAPGLDTAALAAPLMSLFGPWQRLKASLAASSSLNGSSLAVGSASTMVSARPEQSQVLVQHPDAPSPAQPQVSPAQPTPSTGGRRRRAADEDPDERRQRFLERNRAAASRCRQKRKLWVSSLEKKAEELTSQNIQLSNEVTLLRNEVAQLKQLLLAHKDCPVTALQKKTQGYLGES
ncbi:ATF7 factor, partial [Copsychus sechellarum]|nr:ATF7 factor [Copsychus sechellarum]